MARTRTPAALIIAAAFAIAGCGGAANPNEPAGVVTSALDAVEADGLDRLGEFACAAQAGDLLSMLGEDTSSLAALEAQGIDADALIAGMSLDFEDISVSETTKSDTDATVHVEGKVTFKLDEAQFREILATMFEAQGVTPTDEMIDAAMVTMSGQLTQTQEFSDDMTLVKEDGKWVICE